MKNNVYIAGSWKNRNDVKHLMDEIEEWGCKIMVDWTNHKKKDNIQVMNLSENIPGYYHPLNLRSTFIYLCYFGITH